MSQAKFPGMDLCSPAMCMEILRAFSGTNNGEATVLLLLRHIAQIVKTTKAAVVLPHSPYLSKRMFVSISDYDPLQAKMDGNTTCILELPVRKDGRELGKLSLVDEAGMENDPDTKESLQTALEMLAMGLKKWHDEKLQRLAESRHERMERRLKRQNRFLGSLYRISLDMVNQKDYDSLMNSILHYAQNILTANFAAIYILNEPRGLLEMKFLGTGVDTSVLGLSLKKGQGGAGLAWEKGKFLVINDYPNWGSRVRLPWLDAVGTIAFMPLGSIDKLIGVICLGFADTARKVTTSERALMQQFANLASMMSENVRLLNALVRRDEEFTQDIKLAAEVQHTYLPFNHEDPRVQVKTLFEPLHTVSGDLFDYFWAVRGDVLFGYVADVTGHGVTAGLRTAALSALFRESAAISMTLIEKMKWVHGRSLGYFSEGAYFAAICFELDLRKSELRVVCGGLYEFFIKTRYFTGRIEMSGSLMGLKRTPVFEERTYPVRKGDCFYFLTDGFSELIEGDKFPKPNFQESCRCLEEIRHNATVWDDMAGLCIQLKPDKFFFSNSRPELQVYFIGFDEFHAARLQITEFIESKYPSLADDILLAFHEAAGNALRHGSDTRPVFVRVRDYPGHMSIRIRDSGRGFDSRSHLNSGVLRQENRPLACSGRGIGIMLECMDRVFYNISGNEVLLIKKTQFQQ